MKPFRLTYVLFAALFLSFLYFVFFSFHSLIEYERLQNRIERLNEELGGLKKKNLDLEQRLKLRDDPNAVGDSLVRYGYKKTNEILVNIIPPPLPFNPEEENDSPFKLSPILVSLAVASILPLIFLFRFLMRRFRRKGPDVEIVKP